MTTGTATEKFVAKKKPKPPENQDDGGEPLGGERIEFQAPPGFTEKLDTHAKRLGMGRSSYIRMACNRQMSIDDRDAEGGR